MYWLPPPKAANAHRVLMSKLFNASSPAHFGKLHIEALDQTQAVILRFVYLIMFLMVIKGFTGHPYYWWIGAIAFAFITDAIGNHFQPRSYNSFVLWDFLGYVTIDKPEDNVTACARTLRLAIELGVPGWEGVLKQFNMYKSKKDQVTIEKIMGLPHPSQWGKLELCRDNIYHRVISEIKWKDLNKEMPPDQYREYMKFWKSGDQVYEEWWNEKKNK